ncbi:DUF6177 family protein [Sinomonas albida]|uniref:DUF6177 family protein n=1 Tax=Sinomonas albida TaxID=369942 RepID=UPI0030161FB8
MGFEHPLLERRVGRFACARLEGRVVSLSEPLADFIVGAVRLGLVPVVVSASSARWTWLARFVLEGTGGLRVGAIDGGFVDGRDGALHVELDALLGGQASVRGHPPGSAAEAADLGACQATFSVSVHYPPDETTILGRPAELLSLHLAGAPLAAWGPHEPATLQWDPIAFTETARRRMPGDLRLVLAGPGVHMTSLIKRTRTGVEETVSGVALLGPASMDLDTVGEQAANGLAAVAHEVPLAIFGTVTAQLGAADLTSTLAPAPPPVPVAALIGPRAVRSMACDVDGLGREFAARTAGKLRVPSLVASFAGAALPPWDEARRLGEALGSEAISRAFAPSRRGGSGSAADGSGADLEEKVVAR